jgi:hypothetical protein
MNIQKDLYQCLLHLGVDMAHPQGYICSRVDGKPDLVFSFLQWDDGGGMYILLATYLMEDAKAFPEPEVVLWVSPSKKTATVFTCEWINEKEVASPALDARVSVWLNVQIARGHHFRGLRKMPGNVVAFHSTRRESYISPL